MKSWTFTLLFLVVCLYGVKEVLGENRPSEAELALHIFHESGGDDWAVGDKKLEDWAYGPLQIRQPFVDDVNRYYGTHYRASQCRGNRPLSLKIANMYWAIHATREQLGHEPTLLDRGGILNGGPNGWRSWRTAQYRRDLAAMERCQKAGRPLKEWENFRRR